MKKLLLSMLLLNVFSIQSAGQRGFAKNMNNARNFVGTKLVNLGEIIKPKASSANSTSAAPSNQNSKNTIVMKVKNAATAVKSSLGKLATTSSNAVRKVLARGLENLGHKIQPRVRQTSQVLPSENLSFSEPSINPRVSSSPRPKSSSKPSESIYQTPGQINAIPDQGFGTANSIGLYSRPRSEHIYDLPTDRVQNEIVYQTPIKNNGYSTANPEAVSRRSSVGNNNNLTIVPDQTPPPVIGTPPAAKPAPRFISQVSTQSVDLPTLQNTKSLNVADTKPVSAAPINSSSSWAIVPYENKQPSTIKLSEEASNFLSKKRVEEARATLTTHKPMSKNGINRITLYELPKDVKIGDTNGANSPAQLPNSPLPKRKEIVDQQQSSAVTTASGDAIVSTQNSFVKQQISKIEGQALEQLSKNVKVPKDGLLTSLAPSRPMVSHVLGRGLPEGVVMRPVGRVSGVTSGYRKLPQKSSGSNGLNLIRNAYAQ